MKKNIHGRISISSKGDGYVRFNEEHIKISEDFLEGESVMIDHEHLNCALHNDLVEVEVLGKRMDERSGQDIFYGKVSDIIERNKYAHSGKIEEENGVFFFVPDDKKTYLDFMIKKEDSADANSGDKVIVEILEWKDHKKSPLAKVIKILGRPGDNDAEMLSFAFEKGFSDKHNDKVIKEAEEIHKKGITDEDRQINQDGINGRKDFREIITFTIDPADAKDFDDAISFQELENGDYEIGIHIADVSHYLKEDLEMNKEAIFRETSVYLVDRCLPMLPEVLSNDLCSLVQDEERLVMSAVYIVNKNAEIKNEWYGRSIIKSNKRFTYEEAQEILNNKSGLYFEELNILNNLAKILEKKKIENGALVIEKDEVKFKLDEKGVPVDVYIKHRQDIHKMIEEFMLLANKGVSKFIFDTEKKNNLPEISIYRIHDTPDPDKMRELDLFIKSIGEKVRFNDGIIPSSDLNNL